jgi:antitoxin component YwqK of YwqJK toxin-antitoxin module
MFKIGKKSGEWVIYDKKGKIKQKKTFKPTR